MPAFKFKRLPARYHGFVMPAILSFLMSGIVSLVATLANVGMPPGFIGLWLGAWKLSWAIAFPTILVILPLVRRIAALIVEPPAQ